jgi:hypothetical protein
MIIPAEIRHKPETNIVRDFFLSAFELSAGAGDAFLAR